MLSVNLQPQILIDKPRLRGPDKMMVMVAKMIKEERKGTAGVELHWEFGGIGFKQIPLPAKSSRSRWRSATEIEIHSDGDLQLRLR